MSKHDPKGRNSQSSARMIVVVDDDESSNPTKGLFIERDLEEIDIDILREFARAQSSRLRPKSQKHLLS
jgi:hypothetical protein